MNAEGATWRSSSQENFGPLRISTRLCSQRPPTVRRSICATRKRPSRVSASGALPFLLHVARPERRAAAWPRHHTVDGDEERRADRSLRDSRRRSCRSDPSSLPPDLVIGTTSDQQRQVREKLDLFNRSLWEAVALVVLVSFVGFWEWRSALLMALSIPITLAMTFGLMELVGLDIQQMSIASLIIALGLLVDDPVVAGDAIKRELAQGKPRSIAAWLGPDKLSKAILRHHHQHRGVLAVPPAQGRRRRYIYSLPVTIACSLIASRVMSMTFLPLLAYYILKPETGSAEMLRESRFGAWARACRRRRDRSSVEGAGRLFARARRRRVFRRPTFVSSSFPETTSILRMSMFVCRKTRPWLRLCASPGSRPGHPRRPGSSTDRIHRRAEGDFCSRIGHVVHRCRRTAVLVLGAPSRRRPTTRSSCCNSLEAKTRIRSWCACKRSPRASLARESTSARLKRDRRH